MNRPHSTRLAAIALFGATFAAGLAAQDTWLQLPSIGHHADSGAVWDSNRGRVVDFGGSGTSGLPTRTYEWDGLQWVERYPEHTPPGVAEVRLAFDQARGETVLYSGTIGNTSTWTWDGHDWQQRSPATTPPDLVRHSMCYDPIRQVVVLFGGSTSPFLSYSDETWIWDGANWALAASGAASPPARSRHGMAWDPVSQRVLMFGGQNGQGSLQDTWAWDGASWTQLAPATVPPLGCCSTLVSDPVRNVVVLYVASSGSGQARTWEWDGFDWSAVATTTLPTSTSSTFAWDGNTQSVLSSFGFGSGTFAPRNTLSFAGGDWEVIEFAPALSSVRLVEDPARDRIVMFHGAASSATATFEWDGSRWLPQYANPKPPQRLNAVGLVQDLARGETLLFGGVDSNSVYYNETWSWNGSAWTLLQPATSPPARVVSGMVYDEQRGVTVLYGGGTSGVGGQTFYDTWEFDGVDWLERSPATVPQLNRFQLAYDPLRGKSVLFSDFPNPETWEWDGLDWTLIPTAAAPGSRVEMAYHPVEQQIMAIERSFPRARWLFDGTDWTIASPSSTVQTRGVAWSSLRQQMVVVESGVDKTWLLGQNTPSTATTYGSGCPGTNGVPALGARGLPSVANSTFQLELSSARADSIALVQLSPLEAAIPVGGCTMLTGAPSLLLPAPVTSAGGFSELAIPIPVLPQLLGTTWHAQGIVLDPAGAAFSLAAATGGLRLVIGD